jgi:signal transduction histidine kinase
VEGEYEVVGTFLTLNETTYYGIVKAYDIFGHSKLDFLRNVLIVSFLLLSAIVILTTYYLSSQIARPLRLMANEISQIRLDAGRDSISVPDTRDEINFLGLQFNALMKNLNEAFAFQKHVIHHVSHELKTPIAILVSNFERMEAEQDVNALRRQLKSQKEDTHKLSGIINALLDISKAESGNVSGMWEPVRVDDLVYDLISEIQVLDSGFNFEVLIDPSIDDESKLTISANKRLLNSAFTNLLVNCMNYSTQQKAWVSISNNGRKLKIVFVNKGEIISAHDRQFLFQRFFRGANSQGKRGFGLGLVLVHKIMGLHNGKIRYSSEGDDFNIFTLEFSLLEEIEVETR